MRTAIICPSTEKYYLSGSVHNITLNTSSDNEAATNVCAADSK